jgi:hypothetical protein
MSRVLSLLDSKHHPGAAPEPRVVITQDPEVRSLTVHPGNSSMVYTDNDGALELTIKDGKKTLVAKNPKGEQVFSGPIDTPEQRKALAPELAHRLEKIEGMDGFSFQTDGDFDTNVKYLRAGTKIGLPRPAPAPTPEALREPPPPAF